MDRIEQELSKLGQNPLNRAKDNKLISDILSQVYKGEIGGLDGTNYTFIPADGTPQENGEAFLDAYEEASQATPNGNPLSADNRFAVFLGSGYYDFEGDPTFDADFVDISSLNGDRNVVLNGHGQFYAFDQRVFGIKCTGTFRVGENQDNAIFKNCEGGNFSFGYGNVIITSTFVDCDAGERSFGGGRPAARRTAPFLSTMAGACIRCIAGDYSFGHHGTGKQGYFEDCKSKASSFGLGMYGGKYVRCEGGENCFGSIEKGGKMYHCKYERSEVDDELQFIQPDFLGVNILGINEEDDLTTEYYQNELFGYKQSYINGDQTFEYNSNLIPLFRTGIGGNHRGLMVGSHNSENGIMLEVDTFKFEGDDGEIIETDFSEYDVDIFPNDWVNVNNNSTITVKVEEGQNYTGGKALVISKTVASSSDSPMFMSWNQIFGKMGKIEMRYKATNFPNDDPWGTYPVFGIVGSADDERGICVLRHHNNFGEDNTLFLVANKRVTTAPVSTSHEEIILDMVEGHIFDGDEDWCLLKYERSQINDIDQINA